MAGIPGPSSVTRTSPRAPSSTTAIRTVGVLHGVLHEFVYGRGDVGNRVDRDRIHAGDVDVGVGMALPKLGHPSRDEGREIGRQRLR